MILRKDLNRINFCNIRNLLLDSFGFNVLPQTKAQDQLGFDAKYAAYADKVTIMNLNDGR